MHLLTRNCRGKQLTFSRIRVYANVVGLSKALSKAGLSGAEKRSLAPFIANFNRSYPFTDFIDAGEHKENADFKLRGLLRLYAENAQCKHVFFAACHDAGYVSELSPYRGQRDRFTLIATPGLYFHEEFNKLDLGIEELHGVFRPLGSAMDGPYPKPPQAFTSYTNITKGIPSAPKAVPSGPKAISSGPTAAAAPSKQSETGKPCRFYKSGNCRYGGQCNNVHLDGGSPAPQTAKLVRDSWRSETVVAQNDFGAPASKLQQSLPTNVDPKQLPLKAQIPDGHVAVNKNGHRLDAYIEPTSHDAELRLKSRSAEQRLCNSLHIWGVCNNPKCEYDHKPLEADLKPALELLARSVPCPRRGACRNARCTYGHVCQKTDCKYRGGRTYCKLNYTPHIDDYAVHQFVPAASKGFTTGSYGGLGDGRLSPAPGTPDSPREESSEDTGSSSRDESAASIERHREPHENPSIERPRELHEYPVMKYTDRGRGFADEDEAKDDEGHGAVIYEQGAAITPPYSTLQSPST